MLRISKIMTYLTLVVIVAFANPTGYSWMHSALAYPWEMNQDSAWMALFGALLIGTLLFYFCAAWHKLAILGKLIFFTALSLVVFIGFSIGLFTSSTLAAWFAIFAVYGFFIWGMYYPQLNLPGLPGFNKQRKISEDTTAIEHSDSSDNNSDNTNNPRAAIGNT